MSNLATIRRDRHYDLISNLGAELHGVIDGECKSVAAGRRTAEEALAAIDEMRIKTQAAIDASWDELLGGAR